MRLDFEHVKFEWGAPVDVASIAERRFDWLWIAACETSTGVINDVARLDAMCVSRGAKLCVDAVSAIGAVPLDLSNVWLATGASGKALASYPGLALVFHREPIAVSGVLPRYLDLGIYARDGVPFTHSSNLVRALRAAVDGVEWTSRFEQAAATSTWLRRRLRHLGFTIVGDGAVQAPHVLTIALPPDVRSGDVASAIERAGFLIGHASAYLRQRNWIQICLMGEWPRDVLPELLRILKAAV